jgi:hypothetical protein
MRIRGRRWPAAVVFVLLPLSACGRGPSSPSEGAGGCDRTSIGVSPLTELGNSYKGQAGGLYPGGSNAPPGGHVAAGSSLARSIVPLDQGGNPAAGGRYVFVSIGPSFATQEFSVFKGLADSDGSKRPELTIVDGAQGGTTATQWASPSCPCWSIVDQRLAAAGVTPRQVVTAWVKMVNTEPRDPFPGHADQLRENTIAVVRNLKARYPNLRLAYLSSRAYAGYATTTLSPEPYAYETAFAVRGVIAAQLGGDGRLNYDAGRGSVEAPWIAWGPYLWADGLRPRDGLTWACSDFVSQDHTHPSSSGSRKVADLLLSFVKTDSTARGWFAR